MKRGIHGIRNRNTEFIAIIWEQFEHLIISVVSVIIS